jgi:hypothetical protein
MAGRVRHGTVWSGWVWHGRYGMVRFDRARSGAVWSGEVGYGR